MEEMQLNIGSLKKYTDKHYKLTQYKISAPKETTGNNSENINSDNAPNKSTSRTRFIDPDAKKDKTSLSRARSAIFELATCNPWVFFASMTLNKAIRDRYDILTFKKTFLKWLNNYNTNHRIKVSYLLVPEQHQDSAWHLHGLFMGLPIEHLTPFNLTEKLPRKIRFLLQEGREIYNWSAYASAFGFVTLEKIEYAERIAKYITKYISKSVDSTAISVGHHLYYCSKGLNRATKLYQGELTNSFKPDFENGYIKTKTYQSFDEAIQHFTNDSDISEFAEESETL